MFHLIVLDDFPGYTKGDRIEDPAKVDEILASESHDKVIKVAAPEAGGAPASEPTPEPTPEPETEPEPGPEPHFYPGA